MVLREYTIIFPKEDMIDNEAVNTNAKRRQPADTNPISKYLVL